MRCRTVKRKLIEIDLGAARAPIDPRVERHLAGCAACGAEHRAGLVLERDLRMLRSALPFEVDVRATVLARLTAATPARVPAPDRRVLAALAAVLAAIFVALAWGAWHVPALAAGAREAWSIAAAFGRVLAHFGHAWGTTLEAALRATLEWAAYTTGSHGSGASIRSLSFWAAAAMTALTALALLYDFRRDGMPSREEPLA